MTLRNTVFFLVATVLAWGCQPAKKEQDKAAQDTTATAMSPIQVKLNQYVPVKLTTDVSKLSDNQKEVIRLLINAGDIMNDLYWYESYGHRDSLLNATEDAATRKFIEINYGPWDRLDDNKPFIPGVGAKPAGANYYPLDMTKAEFEKADLPDKTSQYTFLRRDENGKLKTIPYHVQFADQIKQVADLLNQAAAKADNKAFSDYLKLRAKALLTDQYYESDMAWMNMKDNMLDVIIGPIETYEDKLFGYKASHECYILVKDKEWSERLSKYISMLPELQKGLPVPGKYKAETPGSNSQLNAYDVIYYAGDCNAGGKTIAVNLPNDERVQLKKGTRRSQLKNAMRAKFDKILVPIADMLIAPEQRKHIQFDAFFANTMFHEVAHGLGIKNTINGKGTVREALKEEASALEEGKADILGLYMIKKLHEKGEIKGDMMDYYVTFMASIFRSVRFGAADAHGLANMLRFNYFKEKGAFTRDDATGTYKVNFDKMTEAMNDLSNLILTLQGNGDYDGVKKLMDDKGRVGPQLEGDLERLAKANIPVDIIFEQGVDVLGLNK